MPRVARVLAPLLAIAAVTVCLALLRRVRDEALLPADSPVDDTLDQSFPASDPPSWSSAAAAPADRPLTRARARTPRDEDPDA